MKKCAIFMMLGIFAVLQAGAYQYEAWVEGTKWYYNIKDGEAEITYGGDEYGEWSYDADIYSGDLVIPEYIDGYSVTSIGEYAFRGCDSLTSIDIPGSIKTVGWGAFQECSSLQYVGTDSLADWCQISFADESANPLYYADKMYVGGTPLGGQLNLNPDIKSIGPYAFAGCSWMTKVVMWDIRSIGDGAFYECDGLREISGGWDVTEIGYRAFWGCEKLTREGIMGLSNSELSVGRSAFHGCNTLSDGDGFIVVHNTLYGYCGSEKSLLLPEGITTISDAAFYNNQTVETLTMPTSLLSYGSAAFFMSKVKNFHIKDLSKWCGVSCENPTRLFLSQDNHYFAEGEEVVDLVVPDGVTSIGKAFFSGCPNLQSVSLPNSVASVGEMSFDVCPSLRRLTTPGNLVLSYSTLSVAEIVVTDGSTSIADGAFAECKTVTSVTIPASVVSLGENVFRGCDNLTDIYFQGDAPTGIENLRRLYSSYGMVTLHVRKGTRGWHACFTDDPNSAQYHIIIEDTEVPVDVEMGGDSAWTQDGGRGYCSGAIDDYQSSKMSVVVDGPTTLAFDWKVSSEEHYDFVSVFLDGELMDRISGSCTDWATVSLSVPKGNGHIVEWSYDKDCETSYGEDKAWVRGIRIGSAVTPFMWVEDSYEGTHCKNAPIGDGESCESSFLATGFGSVYFDLDVSTEKDHDFFQIYIDGVLSESYSGQVTKRSCSVWCDGEKTHRVTFKYVKDASGSDGQDMVRISNFQPYNVKLAWLENGDPMPVENATWVCNDYSSGITRTLVGSGDSVLPMTVSGAGNLTFYWRKLKNSDRLSLYVDGEEAAVCSGSAESQDYGMGYTDGWSYFTYKIMTGGTHQIEWKWKTFGYSEGNAAEIKGVIWGGARQSPWLDNGEEAGKELFGNAKWSRVGEEVFKSGEIGPNQESNLPIYFYSDFYGPAPSLQFEWKVSCGEGDSLVCEVDGSETDYRSKSISGQTDWQSVSVELNSDTGLHSIRWKFKRGNGAPAGENCAWVRNVAFDMAYDDHFKIQWPRMELVGQEEDPGEDPRTYKWSTQVYSDGLVTLIGVSPQPQGVVTLPTEVDGVKVQSISLDVFYRNDKSKIVGVVVPEGYEKIGDFAFSGISNLKAVSLPSTLVELGEAAFSECRSLSYVRLPPALEIIGEWAFEGCAMTHVKVPEGVLEIGSEAFCCMTPRLQEVLLPSTVDSIGFDSNQGETVNPFAACAEGCIIAFPHGNASYEVVNGNLIQSSSRLLLSGVVKGGSVILADVRSIAALAYYRQPTLTEISIPASVKRVGLNAFQESGLERVEMKDGGVEFIDCGAFSMNYSLREIKLPQGLQSIRGEFAWGSLVERLEIPDTVTYLGGPNLVGTFYEMTNLAEVVFNGDAPTQIHVPEQMFGLTPESLTVKVRRGSKQAWLI